MKRLTQILGLSAIMQCTGVRIGKITEVRLEQRVMSGVVVDCEGLAIQKRFIPKSDIMLIGEVSVMVNGKGQRTRVLPRWEPRVFSTAGDRLGKVTDVLIDERTLWVSALEISLGWWDDFQTGRQWLEVFTIHPFGVVVPIQ